MTLTVPPSTSNAWPKAIPLLLLAGLLSYANSFTKAFVFDDVYWITGSPTIADPELYMAEWSRPVVRLSLLLNYRLGGLNPTGYHAFNLLIHILAGLTLYGLLRRILLQPRFLGRYDSSAPYLAFAIALLWLVHPLQTQAVTYIIQRCESMMGLFYLFTFYSWIRGATGGSRGWYLLAVVSFLLSLGCKEVPITLPPLLLIFDRIFLAQSWRELIRRRWLAYLGILGVWVISLRPTINAALGAGNATGVGFGIASATPYQYLLTQSEVILHYVRLAFWPVHQVVDYLDWPIAKSLGEVWLAFAVVAGALAFSVLLLFLRPPTGFVGLWFFAILAPTSSIMPIIDPAFEHRMYLSLAAIAVAVVIGVDALLRVTKLTVHSQAAIAGVALAATAFVLTTLTFSRNEDYRTQATLLQKDAARRPNNPRPFAALIAVYLTAGDLPHAKEAIDKVNSLPNNYGIQHRFRGQYNALLGHLDDANRTFEFLIANTPKDSADVISLAYIYRNEAWVQIALGKPGDAAATIRTLIALEPQVAEYHLILAAAELAAGRNAEARVTAAEAARLAPSLPKDAAGQARIWVFSIAPDSPSLPLLKPKAMWTAAAACLADGDRDPKLLDTLAMAYSWNGRFAEAADAARRGIAAAEAAADTDWAIALRTRLKLYEAGKPYTKGR